MNIQVAINKVLVSYKTLMIRYYSNKLIELEIKDITDTDRSASYLDIHLKFESEGLLRTKLYDKRDDFNFPIVNFPFIYSIYLSVDTIFLSLRFLSGFP